MKKLICALIAVLLSSVVIFGGCDMFGGDVTVNNTYNTMTDEQWQQYMDKLDDNSAEKLQLSINRSLMCGVSILSSFKFSSRRTVYHLIYSGSGVIVQMDKEKGNAYVVTNCHVVYNDESDDIIASGVYLYLYGQDTQGVNYNLYYDSKGNDIYDYTVDDDEDYRIEAKVVGASIEYDIALLEISNSNILKNSDARVAAFSESDDVYAGEQVYAVGNPEGDGMSATVGVISKESETIALNLSDKYAESEDYYRYYRVIRTDAAINGGNSGGGMYNTDGKLVGIINSKSVSEEIDNMGFALPVSNVKRLWVLMKDAYESGFTLRKSDPYIERVSFPTEYGAIYTNSYLSPQGFAEIAEVVAVTSPYKDFNQGDVLKHIKITDKNGKVVEDRDITRTYHVNDTLLSARNGYTATFTVVRDGKEREISFTCKTEKLA